MWNNILLILSSVTLNALAQLFIRQGMIVRGKFAFGFEQVFSLVFGIFTNIYLLAGMFSYGISILLWMAVLSKVNVSLAYPFLSIGYIITAVLAYFIFNEPLTWQKIIGILIICVGVFVLSQSQEWVS
ncbi:MAG: EamA family transporter [Alphaproteobacteria bacterium]|nr:EamA family transporter [Alphaproteobacteria bacterium]